jgi:diadenylate cyclase
MEQVLDIFRVEGWTDLVLLLFDAAIVYYVIYRILLLIKGTRAVQMLFGLVVIIIFFIISQEQYLNLATTHWFIERFIANFIIIVVIIFQHDIRRALAQFGRTSLFSGAQTFEETLVLEEVIKASVMMSTRKIGALIAIEREADLTHYTEEGIKVDSVVSKDLLFSVFVPEHQNPLHDGAVIVQKGRVMAAGCFLPLTNNPRVEKTLGTRHRAGIGLSEEADAAVVIVSEETGIISIAYNGELYRDLDANEMRDVLQRIFTASQFAEPDEALRERFSTDPAGESAVPAQEGTD